MVDRICAYRFGGKFRGKESFGRHRSRWENNIKIDLQEVGFVDIDLIALSQDRTGGGHL